MEVSETVQLALVAVGSPLLLALVTGAITRYDKRAQWKRDDQVAAAVKQASATLQQSQLELIASGKEVQRQVTAVHTLVNSDKTEAIENNLTAIEGQLAALLRLEMVGRRMTPPIEATVEEIGLITSLRKKCDELRVTLRKRAEQLKIVEKQLSADNEVRKENDVRTTEATERFAIATERVANVAEEKKNH